jgi:hypothetical protein
MPPADSVIGSLRSRSLGPVLTPDSIDSVFNGWHAFFYEDRPATGVHSAFRFSPNVVPSLDGTKK